MDGRRGEPVGRRRLERKLADYNCNGRTVARIAKQAASGGDFMARDFKSEAGLGWIGCSRGNLHGRSYRVSSRRDPPDSGSGQELSLASSSAILIVAL